MIGEEMSELMISRWDFKSLIQNVNIKYEYIDMHTWNIDVCIDLLSSMDFKSIIPIKLGKWSIFIYFQ